MRRTAIVGALIVLVFVGSSCVGWADDPVGDGEWLSRSGTPPQEQLKPYTDIIHVGADVREASTRLYVRVLTSSAAPKDYSLAITWGVHGPGLTLRGVSLLWTNGVGEWRVYDNGSPVCSG